MSVFLPSDVASQVEALPPAECPYCSVRPDVPCALHRPKADR